METVPLKEKVIKTIRPQEITNLFEKFPVGSFGENFDQFSLKDAVSARYKQVFRRKGYRALMNEINQQIDQGTESYEQEAVKHLERIRSNVEYIQTDEVQQIAHELTEKQPNLDPKWLLDDALSGRQMDQIIHTDERGRRITRFRLLDNYRPQSNRNQPLCGFNFPPLHGEHSNITALFVNGELDELQTGGISHINSLKFENGQVTSLSYSGVDWFDTSEETIKAKHRLPDKVQLQKFGNFFTLHFPELVSQTANSRTFRLKASPMWKDTGHNQPQENTYTVTLNQDGQITEIRNGWDKPLLTPATAS